MDFITYVRKPFRVKGILVTEDNIEEVAELIGVLETKDDGSRYIEVDREKVPNLFKVYVGFSMTKMDKQYRCYPPQIFEKLFVKNNPELEALIKELNERSLDAT